MEQQDVRRGTPTHPGGRVGGEGGGPLPHPEGARRPTEEPGSQTWHHEQMAERDDDQRSGAQSVERALGLLHCFETERGELRLSDLAKRCGLSVSTAHRLARTLCAAGLLMQNPTTERYGLGPALVVLGRRAEEDLGYDRALPALQVLSEVTGESVNLGIRAGADVLVVLDVVSSSPLRFEQPVGTRVPVHTSAMGKCLLAFSSDPEGEVDALPDLPRFTDRTITDRPRLLAVLEEVGQQGWAVNDGERVEGVRTVAVPVLRTDGTAAGAIAVQGPATRLIDDRIDDVVDHLRATASALGWL
jgi:IclR family transcriptional regulator, acetate operon repressor